MLYHYPTHLNLLKCTTTSNKLRLSDASSRPKDTTPLPDCTSAMLLSLGRKIQLKLNSENKTFLDKQKLSITFPKPEFFKGNIALKETFILISKIKAESFRSQKV